MLNRFFKSISSAFFVALSAAALTACGGGGSPAPAPTGLAVVAGTASVTLTWNLVEGVEYWVFDAPTAVAPASTTNMTPWIGLAGGASFLKVSSPYTISGLVTGTMYSFSVNGRSNGGPGGPGAAAVTATPM